MARLDYWVSRWPVVVVAAMMVLSSSGCVGLTAQLLYMINGLKIPAEYEGLEDKRVAVICVSKVSAYGNGTEAESIARLTAAMIAKEVKNVEVVRYSEIKDWIDNNDWDTIDYRAIGKGVNAEMLVAIDLSNISYNDGQTLYKGRASAGVKVFDMTKGGKVAWSRSLPDFQHPQQGGRPTTEMSESAFKQEFLKVFARDIARSFYAYDKVEALASDAAILGP